MSSQAIFTKQPQASSAAAAAATTTTRRTRAQQPPGAETTTSQSSQQQLAKLSLDSGPQQQQHQEQQLQQSQQIHQQKPATFVDCLIRRFKNCFDDDFCTVPMFVVGSLSPGSDGTHLILPPCVSLGRQHINRFSSPKNLRLMNSIRESCRPIEELDLGGNKLTDLIEVYKILQCTPNLRFLNLSENDLSRSSPVAMASLSTSSPATAGTAIAGNQSGGSNNMIGFSSSTSPNQQQGSFSPVAGPFDQRACLAPLNQNQQQQQHSAIGARRHSSLGQPSGATPTNVATASNRPSGGGTPVHLRARQTISRVAEARRSAAANALAQSRKTSSIVANKLANSAAVSGSLARHHHRQETGGLCRASRAAESPANSASATMSSRGKQTSGVTTARQRLQANQTSTLNLARSLSSLSAKDIRGASTSTINRLGSVHRAALRHGVESGTRAAVLSASANHRRSSMSSTSRLNNAGVAGHHYQGRQPLAPSASSQQQQAKQEIATGKITTNTSHQKLYVEPIAESEDVDMSGAAEQQQISPSGHNSSNSSNCDNQQAASSLSAARQQQATATPAAAVATKALQTTTGNSNTSLRSYCNTNSSLLSTIGHHQYPQQQSGNFRRTFESIKALALNNTGCQWKVVCSILSRMPNLEELHLSLNNYEKIDLDTNEFKHHSLKRLYLCNNPKLTNWEELDKLLIAFPSLEALSIADCNISQIPDNLDRAREWRKLCGLNITGWPIKEWPVVERLNQLPSLVDLKCRNLDVLNSIDEPRHHLIARLPKLQRLNGSEIEEREDAERAFLRFFMVNSQLERPARFHELMQIYGEVPQNIDVDVDLSPPSQARVRVIFLNRNHYCKTDEDDVLMSEDFLLKLMDNIDASASNSQENMEVAEAVDQSGPVRLFKDEGQDVMALEVDLRQSVRKFKSTVASLFGLDSQNLILYYIDHEMVGLMGPELIKHNQKKLWNYNVQDGDQFIVENRQ